MSPDRRTLRRASRSAVVAIGPRFIELFGLTSLDDLPRRDTNQGQLMREPLLTDRLILRDITEADAELLFDLDSDPEVMRFIGPRPAPDLAGYRDRTRTAHVLFQAHPWHGIRVVLDRASGEFLGWVFVRPAAAFKFAREIGWTGPGEAEVGYRYRRSAWGRGLATEAATALVRIALADPATTAVVACALASNAGSLRVLEKLGLERVEEVMLPETNEPTVKLARVK
jgi:RimJ/RimL family protein N-acetyltransferase